MRLSKYTHACVRIDDLVIDPGEWSEAEALEDAAAVLITHEHADHVDPEKLTAAQSANPQLRVFAPEPVLAQLASLENTTAVRPGDSFEAAGKPVRAVGGRHAFIYGDQPDCVNIGYLVESSAGSVYHPGDSVEVPEADVDILLTPVHAPWLKFAEAVDLVRQVAPQQAYPIHDGMLNALGLAVTDRAMTRLAGEVYSRVPDGGNVEW